MSSDFDNRVVIEAAGPYLCGMSRTGADLALLLLGAFRALADAAHVELARRGYDDMRPVHDFAMRAIGEGAGNASDLARRLSVSKQAAAKTVAVLEARGYVRSQPDPTDARRKRLQVTALGVKVLRQGEAVFDELHDQWARQIGPAQLASVERHLRTLVGDSPIRFDLPGGVPQDRDDAN